jgi:hypothetical protein
MARRPSLTDAGVTRPSQNLLPPSAAPPDAKRAPVRQGKKAIAFWVDAAASRQLRTAAASMDRTIQDVMEEALDDWFRKHGLSRIATSSGGQGA